MAVKNVTKPSARERLLAAADELFYDEGVHTVGIDRVIEHAGVAKASLYNLFGSKEELVAAYLASRHDRTTSRLTEVIESVGEPRQKILAVFDSQAQQYQQSDPERVRQPPVARQALPVEITARIIAVLWKLFSIWIQSTS